MLIVGFQSCAVYGLSSLANRQDTVGAGAVGIVVAFLFLVGGAFVMALPIVSTIIFVLAALSAFLAGTTSGFSDMTIWGFVSLALAAMSFLGWRELRRRRLAQQQGSAH